MLSMPIILTTNYGTQSINTSGLTIPSRVAVDNRAPGGKAFVPSLASPPSLSFANTWGGIRNEIGMAVASDSAGNLYEAGSTTSFGFGASDVFLLKYDSSGNLIWQRTWGGNGEDIAQGVASDPGGNIYVTGHTTGFGAVSEDAFLLKFSSSGDLVWQRIWGSTVDDEVFGIAVDSSANIYLTGHTSSSGAGGNDVFLLKFASDGGLLWRKTWGGAGEDIASSLAVSLAGSVYVTGYTTSFGAGGPDVFLLKYDPAGSLVWQRIWGGPDADFGSGVATDFAENIYLTGYTNSFGSGLEDVLLLKFSPAGDLVWAKLWGGAGDDVAFGVSTNPSGDIHVTGYTTSVDAGKKEIFLLRFGSTGELEWEQTLTSMNGAEGRAVIADALGGVLGVGYVSGPPPYTAVSRSFLPSTPTVVLRTTGNQSSPNSPIPVRVPDGMSTIPSGSTSYTAGQDALLFKFVSPTSPSPPLNLQAANGIGMVSLNWNTPLSNGRASIMGYRVYRGTIIGEESLLATIGNLTSYLDTSVLGGTTYYYKLTALNALGESAGSNEAAIISLPSGPQSLQAQAGTMIVALTWRPPAVNGGVNITGYNVYRGTSSGGELLLISLGNQLSYNDSSVSGGLTYFYKVAAVNPSGPGALSNEASAMLQAPPSAPLQLIATARGGVVHLSWNPPMTNGGSPILGYNLYRGTHPGGYVLYRVLENQTAFTDDGTDCLIGYGFCFFYRVTAFNAVGEGPSSNEANPTPAAPLNALSMTSMAIIFLSVLLVTVAVRRLRVQ